MNTLLLMVLQVVFVQTARENAYLSRVLLGCNAFLSEHGSCNHASFEQGSILLRVPSEDWVVSTNHQKHKHLLQVCQILQNIHA